MMTAKITLFGRATSVNVQKALWALHETKVEFEWKESESQIGWPNNPDYLKINPNGRVPSLIVGDQIIRQSNVIVRYVAYSYARGSLWPEDALVRAHSDEWMDWQQTELYQNITPVFWGLVRTPMEKRDMKAIGEAANKLNGNFKVLEGHLAERKWKYVAGDSFTMGDIPVGAALYRYMAMPLDRPSLPNVKAYYERMLERPAFQNDIVMPLS